ncbi:AraC family transcriptional regulator N-terminal domain-containing protein [Agrobacterium sp. MCAB5]|uniref:AraC family transcriptional regulator n=1 Tax=Agrobacterium sp. MCAB5 TaxID=3233042 RepID=UPI003F8EE488
MLFTTSPSHAPNDGDEHRLNHLRSTLALRIGDVLPSDGEHVSPVPGLLLIRRDSPSDAVSALYEPSLALPVQGRKRVILGADWIEYDPDRFLLTSVDLPTMSHVIEASSVRPFLSIMLKLDLQIAQEVAATIDSHGLINDAVHIPMALGTVTADLLDAVIRLEALADRPGDIPFMGPLLMREVTYRLLLSPAGAWLREIAMLETRGNRIGRVIVWLRENHARSVRVEELAEMAAMGVSTFHHHFSGITRMSPLQFQKHIRLHEARRLLLTDRIDAATAALSVGYESATQFNREYRRLFGNPPIRDTSSLRDND